MSFLLIIFFVMIGLVAQAYVPEPQPVKSDVEITAIYYPGTEHMPEWDMIAQTCPERKPLLGWYDEGNPEAIDWQIKWAVEHGISNFCVDWYWNDGNRRLEHWIKGFYKARFRRHLKWFMMYANHNQPGSHSTADQIAITKYWIDNYFKTPEYYTIDGKPAVCVWSWENIDRDFIAEAAERGETLVEGEGVKRAFAISEKLVREAGLPGIYWIDMWRTTEFDLTYAERRVDQGYRAAIHYGIEFSSPELSPEALQPGDTKRQFSYDAVVATAPKLWEELSLQDVLPYWVILPTGWDDRPRSFAKNSRIIRERTPEKFADLCRKARTFCNRHGKKHVVILPINEWQEGSYIEPNEEHGFGMYDAIRDAFCKKPVGGWPKNIMPSDVGLGPYDFPPMYQSPVQSWTFDDSTEHWYRQPYGGGEVECHDGCLTFVVNILGNYNVRQRLLPFSADRYAAFRVRMKITPNAQAGLGENADPGLRLKWGTEERPIIGEGLTVDARSMVKSAVMADGEWHEYELPLSGHPDWKGHVNELWFEAADVSHARVAVDWMRFLRPEEAEKRIRVSRVMRPPRPTRGNTNVCTMSPIDEADWIRAAEPGKTPSFWRYEKAFESDGTPLTVDVSADERFVLMLDGQIVGRGPDRSSVEHWVFHAWRLELEPGSHTLSAVVWQAGEFAPAAQTSNGKGGGFILKADGVYDGQLTTGRAHWRVGRLSGTRFAEEVHASRADGAGFGVIQEAPGFLAEVPTNWESPVSAVDGVRLDATVTYGARRPGWMLYPSSLPEQLERKCFPGEFRAGGEKRFPIRLAAGEKRTILWDLGNYYCAYPVLRASGGRGARIVWGWAESLFDSVDPKRPGWGRKGDRSKWEGKVFLGTADEFRPCAGATSEMTVPWWRCGRWCRIELEAGEGPLVIESMGLVETRYPLEDEGSFACDDPDLEAIQPMCVRGLQMCAHETLMDCPFYEQQMYAADTRVQLKVLSAFSADGRMARRAIELLDFSRRDNGLCAMNYPSSGLQESSSFTLCWMMMFGDYVMTHLADDWLRFRRPGLMSAACGLRAYENEQGLLVGLPGWNFVDWEPSWGRGVPPDAESEKNPSAVLNLFWVLAQQSVARVARVSGDADEADLWGRRAGKTAASVMERYWDPTRKLLADDVSHRSFSELTQSLAIIGDVLPADKRDDAFASLLSDEGLARCTVYASYYLFEALFKMGRADVFCEKLGLWHRFFAQNLKTPLESPSTFGDCDARSDCHAWGSHPLYFMRAGIAGIRPAAPGYARVDVSPCPGPLKFVQAAVPHPNGRVEVDFIFDRDRVTGRVVTPVPGVFRWKNRVVDLHPGVNGL